VKTHLLQEGDAATNGGRSALADSTLWGPRILLLTPYTGSNFGDGAIQDAVIDNLRRRLTRPQIRLVTLCPERTSRLHGLPSFSIGSVEIPEQPRREEAQALQKGDSPLLAWIRRIPWLHRCTATIGRPIRRSIALSRDSVREIRHVFRVRALLRDTDLLVMSGGGQIDDFWGGAFGHPYALLKWSLVARFSKVPVVFPSVGVCVLKTRTSRFFAYRALKLASYRSYRDHGSKELLSSASFTRNDAECPDLAFSHPRGENGASLANGTLKRPHIVGLSPIIYLSQHGWPESDSVTYDRYLSVLCEFAEMILTEGHTVVLFVSAAQDQSAVEDLQRKLAQSKLQGSWGDRLQEFVPVSADELLDGISKMDLVAASRLHGVLLSHVLQKPVLAVSYDRKVRAHMASLSQEAFCLELTDCTAPQLWERFLVLAAQMEPVSHVIQVKTEEFRRKLAQQYDLLTALLVESMRKKNQIKGRTNISKTTPGKKSKSN
jgi:polysaccharide pyruvyl transferase WcaK-like protein